MYTPTGTQFRSILRRLCHLYPASKIAEAVLGGLSSKNTRTHTECLDELRRLVAESGSGWHVVGRKGVKQIAKNVKSSSGEIRNGALQVLQQVWLSLQCDETELLKIAGVKTQKVKDLIHEKLRHQKSSSSNSSSKTPKKTSSRVTKKTPTKMVKTPGKKPALAFKSPAISRLTGSTSVVASPVNFNFKPLRVSLSPGGIEEEEGEEDVVVEQEEEKKEDVVPVLKKHIDSISCFAAFLKEYPSGNDGAGNDLLDLAKESIESLTSSSLLSNEFPQVCIAISTLNDVVYAAASQELSSTTDGDEKLSEWRIKLKSFLWQSVGVMQTMFSMSEIAKCSSVKSLVAVLKFTLNVLVHLRKTCDEKQGKWYEIRSRCNLLTIHAAQHASRVTTYLALFELYALVLRNELVRDSQHVLQRLLRKIKSHDSAMSQDFKLEKQGTLQKKDVAKVSRAGGHELLGFVGGDDGEEESMRGGRGGSRRKEYSNNGV